MCHWLGLNLGKRSKITIIGSLLTIYEVSNTEGVDEAVPKMVASINLNRQIKLSLTNSHCN